MWDFRKCTKLLKTFDVRNTFTALNDWTHYINHIKTYVIRQSVKSFKADKVYRTSNVLSNFVLFRKSFRALILN